MNDEIMSFGDAVIILRKWRSLKDSDFVTKREVDDYVTAMFIVNTTRR